MTKEARPDMSCARVKQYQSSDIGAAERHNERKNDSYENINVVPERIPLNVHFRTPPVSYMDSYITNVGFGKGLLKCGNSIVPFVDNFPKNTARAATIPCRYESIGA